MSFEIHRPHTNFDNIQNEIIHLRLHQKKLEYKKDKLIELTEKNNLKDITHNILKTERFIRLIENRIKIIKTESD